MTETFYDGQVVLHAGKCEVVLRDLPDNSVDAVVCDPPYALNFMGRDWDTFRSGYHAAGAVPQSGQRPVSDEVGAHDEGYRNMRGRESDFQAWCEIWARECLRILKPGGHLLAFGGTRTYHRLVCGIEDAGFEIRDSLHWIYGSGFPKSLNVSKAIDKAGGVSPEAQAGVLRTARERANLTREQVAERVGCTEASVRDWEEGRAREKGRATESITPSPQYRDALAALLGYTADERRITGATVDRRGDNTVIGLGHSGVTYDSDSATEDAARWDGWGTALKPAHEPIVVARKPLTGTVIQNVLTHGTGAINVAGTRVGTTKDTPASPRRAPQGPAYGDLGNDPGTGTGWDADTGRWPPNVLLTHSADCVLQGTRKVLNPSGSVSGKEPSAPTDDIYGKFAGRVPYKARGSGGIWTHGNGVPVGPQYGEPDGTETVDAWDCAPDCPVRELDRQSGVTTSSGGSGLKSTQSRGGLLGGKLNQEGAGAHFGGVGDKGGASRFFPQFGWDEEDFWPFKYQAKAPKKERPKLPDGTAWPTVKPIALMKWLVKLVTPPGGTCLDPFAGTGTTAQACIAEDFNCILIDNDKDALNLIRKRMTRDVQPGMF